MKSILIAALLLHCSVAFADVFQCLDENGQSIYTDDQTECVDPRAIVIDEQDTIPVDDVEPATSGETFEDDEIAIESDADLISVWGAARAIDGILEKQEWGNVPPYIGKLTLSFGNEEDLLLYVMNDDEFLYIAIEFKTQKFISNEALFITLDQQLTGEYYEGQDILGLGVNRDGSQVYYDHARTLKSPCIKKLTGSHKVYCAFQDTRMHGTTDGMGSYRFQNQTAVYEFKKPLKSDDREYDVQLEQGQIVGLKASLTASRANYTEVFVPGPTHKDNLIVKIAEKSN